MRSAGQKWDANAADCSHSKQETKGLSGCRDYVLEILLGEIWFSCLLSEVGLIGTLRAQGWGLADVLIRRDTCPSIANVRMRHFGAEPRTPTPELCILQRR